MRHASVYDFTVRKTRKPQKTLKTFLGPNSKWRGCKISVKGGSAAARDWL